MKTNQSPPHTPGGNTPGQLPDDLAKRFVQSTIKREGGWLLRLRRHFFAGLLVVTPLGVTLWIVIWAVNLVDGKSREFLQSILLRFGLHYEISLFGRSYELIPFGFGLLVVFIGTCFIGMVASNFLGKKVLAVIDSTVRMVPGVSWIYNVSTQVSHAFLNRNKNIFTQAVIVEYPRLGIYSIGFVTNDEVPGVEAPDGKGLQTVFIPTTPNPTSGYLLFIPQDQWQALPISVEEAMKLVISGGVWIPESLTEEVTQFPSVAGTSPAQSENA